MAKFLQQLNKIWHSPFFLIYLLALLNIFLVVKFITIPHSPHDDTSSYVQAAQFLTGEKIEFVPYYRLLMCPLFLYSILAINFLVHNLAWSMFYLNLGLYLIIIYVFYKLADLIYKNKTVATISTILFSSNYFMLFYGTAMLADLSGWLFFILGQYFVSRYYFEKNSKDFYLAILVSSIGILFKEYGTLSIISLGLVIIISDHTWLIKIKSLLKSALLFLIIPGLYHLVIYFTYHYSYFNWYGEAAAAYNSNSLAHFSGWIIALKVTTAVFFPCWLAWFLGAYYEWQEKNRTRLILLACLLPSSLAFLAWPAIYQRMGFILVPWLALTAGFGLAKLPKHYIIIFVVLYLLINYNLHNILLVI